MTISKDDEREAREWLLEAGVIDDFEGRNQDDRHRATILALLDAPRLPRPEDVPRGVLEAMERVFYERFGSADSDDMRGAYRALYDHYTAPPKVKEWWAVEWPNGVRTLFSDLHEAHKSSARHGGRILRMVEDRDDE